MSLKVSKLSHSDTSPGENPAANLVRSKLKLMYDAEPAALEEKNKVEEFGAMSKHQKYMQKLVASGLSLADIQIEWHKYYQSLGDAEKHAVWQEFYEQHSKNDSAAQHNEERVDVTDNSPPADAPHQTLADLRKKVLHSVSAGGKLKPKHHFMILFRSIATASVVTGIMFFVFNNQTYIAPFINPSSKVSASPIITDGTPVGPETKIIIPKINLETGVITETYDPLDLDVTWKMMEKGVVLYPYTGLPGEKDRNPVLFGHSSNNIFNGGSAKFVFVRLHDLEIGDTYAINYGGTQYVYKVFGRHVVNPDQVEYLSQEPAPLGKIAMSTLITCDPPGTAYKRLIIQGEQISPNPTANTAPTSAPNPTGAKATTVPSNAPSLFKRLLKMIGIE